MEKELRRSCSSVPILVVDRDTTSLMCLASMLEQYSYNVTTTELAAVAISMIRKGSERFKLVLADISNDEMNTLSLLIVSVRMNIPVILMSNETNPKFAQQLIGYGASLHLQKPISLNDLKYLWQHAFRRPRVSAAKTFTYLLGTGLPTINDPKGKSKELTPTDRSKDDRQMLPVAMGEEGMKYGHGGSMSETSYKFGDKDGEKTRNGNSIASRMNRSSGGRRRKTRLVWSKELHHKFAAAITALGDESNN
ncbi:hypothetical protein F3Y22_tig00116962pilonHSYRG00078 [Hibiscus syriacus]|uniref:Response regulatory domain-containing protein n=1 Tax=Hibiscus syriacus TaxID=106335 RepID=A0A6A2WKK0_HIBSY|nr:hypothetical protein F3Y22_tig00116962pilonHSYRG00078 [Hibiscus syriacus]